MEVKSTKKVNKNGVTVEKTVVKSTPEDGFVNYGDVMPTTEAHESNIKHKGYTYSFQCDIKDPKITRPVSFIFYGIFLIIGIIFLFVDYSVVKAFGIFWILLTIVCFIKTQKDINRIAKELKEEQQKSQKE